MIEGDKIFGVSLVWIAMIIFFFLILAELILGQDSTAQSTVQWIVVFLSLGTTLLIGHFGWQILVLPSIVILSATAWVVWKRLN